MRRAAFLMLVLIGCSKKPGVGGLEVHVTVDPRVQADCVQLIATSGGTERPSERLARKPELTWGVVEGDGLSGEVSLVARGTLGPCDEAGVLNAQSAAVTERFVAGKVVQVQLALDAALDDADGDGVRAKAQGGTDCDDSSADVAPGLDERCADGRDNDCNGKTDCADAPKCEGASCSDGKACTSPDVCSQGRCAGPVLCVAQGACSVSLGCGADGGCLFATDAGVRCDGGTCRQDGACIPDGQEWSCTDLLDNDGDQQIDCDDADCVGVACDDRRACTVGDVCQPDVGCMGAIACSVPPPGACWGAMGTCGAGGACEYLIASGMGCDDGQRCTHGDVCHDDGGCSGTAYTCGLGSCFMGGACEGDGGCSGVALTGTACDDGDLCTFGGVCDAGRCESTAYDCVDRDCEVGLCQGDGGCGSAPKLAGTACPGGACDTTGVCVRALWPFMPSNFAPSQIPDGGYGGAVVFDAGCDAVFDSTDSGFTGWCGPRPVPLTVAQTGGPELVVLPVQGLTLEAGSRLRVIGERPVAIAVVGDARISGQLLATSTAALVGAGANWPGCGTSVGEGGRVDAGMNVRGGGGGGGTYGTRGSDGAGVVAGLGGRGGVLNPSAATLKPLRGGCPGGAGGALTPSNGGRGGAGGGALQLSVAGTLTIAGVISASGAGGQGGALQFAGGGGGGSGGALLLEASTLVLVDDAALTCNGGGGGEGSGTGIPGRAGADGSADAGTPAAGGSLGTSGGGDGANGAARGVDAGAAMGAVCEPPIDGEGCGAGGGGLGRLRIQATLDCVVGDVTISAQESRACP